MSKKKEDPAQQAAEQQNENAEQHQDDVQDALHPTNPENETVGSDSDGSLHVTGEVSVDAPFEDNQVMSRLRTSPLTTSEIYREAQTFCAQNLDVASLLGSGEGILIQNTAEILRALDIYHPAAVTALVTNDARTQEVVGRYLLHCLRRELVLPTALTDSLTDIASTNEASASAAPFADKLCGAILGMLSQPGADISALQTSLTRLCGLLAPHTVSRLLYDPSPIVRAAVIRSFQNRGEISVNDLSLALILLKDKDENVNIALMRMFARFATFPELVIPQLLAIFQDASDNLKKEIFDVYRSYGNDIVDPIMQSLDSIQPGIFESAREAIVQCPPRFTSALLKHLTGGRTSNIARQRIIAILKGHKDPTRREEICRALSHFTPAKKDDVPEWKAPDTSKKHLEPASDDAAIYHGILSDDEIAKLAKTYKDDLLNRLLSDASETVQINALRIIRRQKKASAANIQLAQVWLKSSNARLAAEALETVLSLEKSEDSIARTLIDAFSHCESDETKQHFIDIILARQNFINAMIHAFYEMPRICANFIMKFLAAGPNQETLDNILAGLERSQSVACIAETMNCLLMTRYDFDNRKIRPLIMSHVQEPISFGQHGFMTRLRGLKLLRKFMLGEEERDGQTISALQAFYKEGKNAELRAMTKNLLKDLGEEIFDFDDEEDDFEDLNDERDE